jgi:hypothetical protein
MSSPPSATGDRYRRRWRVARLLATACGLCLAAVEWSVPAVVVGLVIDTLLLVAGLRGLAVLGLGPTRRTTLRGSSSVVSGIVALAALTSASPRLGVVAVCVTAATSPAAVDRLRGRLPPGPGSSSDAPGKIRA